MLKYLYFIFSLCFIFLPIKYVHPELRYYYQYFKYKVEEQCVEMKEPPKVFIYFSDLKDYNIGFCHESYFGTYYRITIDRNYWTEADFQSRMNLMMHELAHCVLNKDHVDDKTNYMYKDDTVVVDLDRQVEADIKQWCSLSAPGNRK